MGSAGLAAVIGTVVLFAVLFYGWIQSRRRNDVIDPGTPGDDPAKGMHSPPGPPAGNP